LTNPVSDNQISITQKAKIEWWSDIRYSIHRQMVRLVLTGTGYLVFALLIGSFLIQMMERVGRGTVYLTWEPGNFFLSILENPNIEWMHTLFLLYLLSAACCLIASIFTILFIKHRLTAWLSRWMANVPLIGPTMECLAAAELCQTVYQCVSSGQPYPAALEQASVTIGNPSISHWADHASKQLDQGQAFSDILGTSPLRVPPLAVLSGVFLQEKTPEQTVALWESATEESHLLAQSRFARANVFLSNMIILVSAFIAAYALYSSSSFLLLALEGLT
jgi:hypothetical protein